MADALAVSLHASGAETSSSSGTAVDIGALRTCLEVRLDVSAASGTFASGQGLIVTVETSTDGTTGWTTVSTFQLLKAVATIDRVIGRCRQYVRASWAITGTGSPSFTFALTGQAHTLYAEISDLALAITPSALQSVSDEDKNSQLLRATTDMETALNSAFELPLTAWGHDVRGTTADRATYYIMMARGFDPDNATDQLILLKGGVTTIDGRRTGAQRFLDDIAGGKLKPVGVADATPDDYEGGGFVISDDARG